MMKHCGLLLIVCSIGLLSCAQRAGSQEDKSKMTTQDAAANKALETLPSLVTKDNFGSLGFSSEDEAKNARLGEPIPRMSIGYDQLLRYSLGMPLSQVLDNTEQLIYPIQAQSGIKSSVLLTKADNAWQISSVADRYFVEILAQASDAKPRGNTQVVSVPGLHLEFIGVGHGDNLVLSPVRDYPSIKLTRGREIGIQDALPILSDYAKAFDKQYGEQIRKRQLSN